MKKVICMRGLSLILCLALLVAPWVASVALAWSNDPTVNTPISTTSGDQGQPSIVSDGAGGAIITWHDRRSGTNWDIYAQRVDSAGAVQWTANGLAISTASGNQTYPTIASDGAGGAIIAWGDRRSGTNWDIYAQRVNSSGTPLWIANGVAISTASGGQSQPTIVSDGAGGAIITWEDLRSGTNWDIYAQRVNSAGTVQWTANGVAISTASDAQLFSTIESDGAGGAIITWEDRRSGTSWDIYAQRVNSAGIVQWIADGVAISTASGDQRGPTIVSDGSGGAIITWSDGDIHAQRVNSAGAVQWTANGVAISTASGGQFYPTIVSDGAGGAIITWHDRRSGTNWDIYAQRVNSAGAVQWTANGVAISTASSGQTYPTIVSDGSGRAIITWEDYRSSTNWDIYAQRVDATPPGAVTNLAVVGGSVNSLTLMWTAPGDDGNVGTASQYDIRYSTITPFNWGAATPCAGEPAPQAAGSRETFVVTPLSPGTYHFALKTADEVLNWSLLSNVPSATTPTPIWTPSGTNVQVTDPTGVVITFSNVSTAGWTTVFLSQINPCGEISGYRFLGKYYDITTGATYTGLVTVTIPYNEGDIRGDEEEEKLHMFRCPGTSWADVTKSVDTGNNTITGEVPTLSWYAVAGPEEEGGGGGGGGFCFIATAAYGSYLDGHVETLRNFRDQYLLTNPVGSALVSAYYNVSPPVADFIDDHPTLKPIVRTALLPAVGLSAVAVNTTLAEKMAIVGSLALASVLLAMWARKRQGKGSPYS